ncbi:GNAT family N-acetyltransferase [uncultured Campylobacter sp.]|jgi:amino-acid N-acetyltransferase|uniref:GNAT family N-acetyltransferase n=1 Tax=uncultured Campylobacter sp. TaxID=218934 RepID=UPI0028EB147C|nr:GNAT family N-acetyltransferase [uncultured Campylobacter sp.]
MIRLKKARLCDISRMQELVKEEVQNGVILPLESDEIAANIRSYVLAFGCDFKADTSFDSKENLSFDSKENSDSNLARNADLNLIQSSAANFAKNSTENSAENAADNFAPQLATPQSAAQAVSEVGCAQAGKEQILRSEYSQSAGVFKNDLSRLCESQSAKDAEILTGFASLKIFNADLAEVRSLIVAPQFRRRGIARAIVNELLDEAKFYGLKSVFTLTYQKEFFKRLGFTEIPKDELPAQKIWADCIKCKKFPVCNEIALIYTL